MVRGAFGAVFADPVLRSLVITVAILAAAVAAVEGVLVIYATGPLGLKAALFPTLLIAQGPHVRFFGPVPPSTEQLSRLLASLRSQPAATTVGDEADPLLQRLALAGLLNP